MKGPIFPNSLFSRFAMLPGTGFETKNSTQKNPSTRHPVAPTRKKSGQATDYRQDRLGFLSGHRSFRTSILNSL